MTKLSIVEPEVGQKNSVADPRIPAALKEIEKVVNGELEGTNNIKAGGVLEANLSEALLEKLTTKLGFKLEEKNESFTAVSEKAYLVVKEAATAELPAPTVNRIIALTCGSAINAFKVKCSSGKVFSGIHQAGATTVEVTKSSTIMVLATGTNWFVIAGEEKDERVYASVGVLKAEAEAGVEPSPTREALVTVAFTEVTTLTVGGVVVATAIPAGTPLTVAIKPGQKWKASAAGGAATILQ